jgi:hypothetical protein
MVDLEAPNYDDWPQFAQVKGTVCILEPGDVLYTPMVGATRTPRKCGICLQGPFSVAQRAQP